MKNKNLYIIIAAVAVVLITVGGYLMFGKSKNNSTANQTQSLDENVTKLTPEEIGLELVASPNNKQVKFIINKPSGIIKLEYELSYEADSTGGSSEDGESSDRISRGVAGEDSIDSDESTYESKYLDLGSCSSGTCKYDKGVTKVHLLLKLTKTDGKVYQVEDDLQL